MISVKSPKQIGHLFFSFPTSMPAASETRERFRRLMLDGVLLTARDIFENNDDWRTASTWTVFRQSCLLSGDWGEAFPETFPSAHWELKLILQVNHTKKRLEYSMSFSRKNRLAQCGQIQEIARSSPYGWNRWIEDQTYEMDCDGQALLLLAPFDTSYKQRTRWPVSNVNTCAVQMLKSLLDGSFCGSLEGITIIILIFRTLESAVKT